MKPTYERPANVIQQARALERLARSTGDTYAGTEDFAAVDAIVVKRAGKVYAVLEFKGRAPPEQADTIWLSAVKAQNAIRLSFLLKCKAIFGVEVDGRIGTVDIRQLGDVTAGIRGRKNRPNDPDAYEWVLLVPRSKFTWLKERDDGRGRPDAGGEDRPAGDAV